LLLSPVALGAYTSSATDRTDYFAAAERAPRLRKGIALVGGDPPPEPS